MSRALHLALLLSLGLLVWMEPGRAEPPAPGAPAEEPAEGDADPVPALATDEAAASALETFKDAYKARGFKGDEKTAVRELAMRRLAEVQHVQVADQLYKLTRDRDPDLRTLAVMYLGEQRAIPGYAGPLVAKALKSNASDAVLVMFGVDALSNLGWRGSVPVLRELMRHKDDMVRKVALLAIGDMGELRMLEDLLLLAKDLKIDKGWKTEGHEVRYDSGAEGDHDQKMAEKMYKQKYGSTRKGRTAGRAMRDLKPVLLEALKRLTGEEFYGREQAEDWAEAQRPVLDEKCKALDEEEEAQAEQARLLAKK